MRTWTYCATGKLWSLLHFADCHWPEDGLIEFFRSDAAYDRAAAGAGNADGFTVVETGANGLATMG